MLGECQAARRLRTTAAAASSATTQARRRGTRSAREQARVLGTEINGACQPAPVYGVGVEQQPDLAQGSGELDGEAEIVDDGHIAVCLGEVLRHLSRLVTSEPAGIGPRE